MVFLAGIACFRRNVLIALPAIVYVRCKRKRLESQERNNNRRIKVKKIFTRQEKSEYWNFSRNLDLAIGKTTFDISECQPSLATVVSWNITFSCFPNLFVHFLPFYQVRRKFHTMHSAPHFYLCKEYCVCRISIRIGEQEHSIFRKNSCSSDKQMAKL